MDMHTPSEGDDNVLIQEFNKGKGNSRAGDALFRRYQPGLKKACRKFRGRCPWLELDDLESAAYWAFAKALDNYDPSSGTFAAYLWKYVPGALRAELEDRMRRGTTGSGKVGRWLSGNWHKRKGLPPEEIAKRTGRSPETAKEVLAAEIAIREGMVWLDEVERDADGDSPVDYAKRTYFTDSKDLALRRKLDAQAALQRELGWARYRANLGRAEIVKRKEPRLRLVIDNAPMAQKGHKWNPQKKPYNAMASSLRLESTPAWREPWTPSHGGSC
jgi:DNA-directed RNA polymerase specialized sigma subunit